MGTLDDGVEYALSIGVVILIAMALNSGHSATRCTEDMSCWNCETMGNHICGGK
jgi:hypothetical protein